MKWPWHKHPLEEPDDLPTADKEGSQEALRQVEQHKAEVEARWPTVNWLTSALDTHRRENHFSDLFSQAMRRRP